MGHDVNIIKNNEDDPRTVLSSLPILMDWLPVPVSDLTSKHTMEGPRGITSEAGLHTHMNSNTQEYAYIHALTYTQANHEWLGTH